MTKLYEYLISNYKPNEPIFVSDLQLSISDANLQQMFNLLCDSGTVSYTHLTLPTTERV